MHSSFADKKGKTTKNQQNRHNQQKRTSIDKKLMTELQGKLKSLKKSDTCSVAQTDFVEAQVLAGVLTSKCI